MLNQGRCNYTTPLKDLTYYFSYPFLAVIAICFYWSNICYSSFNPHTLWYAWHQNFWPPSITKIIFPCGGCNAPSLPFWSVEISNLKLSPTTVPLFLNSRLGIGLLELFPTWGSNVTAYLSFSGKYARVLFPNILWLLHSAQLGIVLLPDLRLAQLLAHLTPTRSRLQLFQFLRTGQYQNWHDLYYSVGTYKWLYMHWNGIHACGIQSLWNMHWTIDQMTLSFLCTKVTS